MATRRQRRPLQRGRPHHCLSAAYLQHHHYRCRCGQRHRHRAPQLLLLLSHVASQAHPSCSSSLHQRRPALQLPARPPRSHKWFHHAGGTCAQAQGMMVGRRRQSCRWAHHWRLAQRHHLGHQGRRRCPGWPSRIAHQAETAAGPVHQAVAQTSPRPRHRRCRLQCCHSALHHSCRHRLPHCHQQSDLPAEGGCPVQHC